MDGLMMRYPLTLPRILERARTVFADQEVVSTLAGGAHRYTYRDLHQRVLKTMDVLKALGVKRGDRVATFAWNHYRHLELYWAVPAVGAVLHTLNLRLSGEQLTYIVNHAGDSVLFVDDSLLKPIEALADQLKPVRQYVVMGDGGLPGTALKPVADYERLMTQASPAGALPDLDENEACGLCYTSGTTGKPKGVLYTHRSNYLHAMMASMTDVLGLTESDVLMPIVPMFHANAWGTPYSCAMTGAKLVFAGSNVQPDHILRLIASERVTLAFGVPTIWNGLLQHLRQHGGDLGTLRGMVVGGSAVPRSMIEAFQKEFGVGIIQGWGMTEMSPLGTTARLSRKMMDWPEARRFDTLAKAGKLVPNVEAKIVNDREEALPWDGKSVGELLVRGPCIASGYYNNDEAASAFTKDGWFRTGDVASIDDHAFVQIADRTKDLIKSGGEWISSVEMENAVMACSGVLEAAVVARPDAKWDERPVVFVVISPGKGAATADSILSGIAGKFAKWQLPSTGDIHFIEQIPKTSVGKFDKKVLRTQITTG